VTIAVQITTDASERRGAVEKLAPENQNDAATQRIPQTSIPVDATVSAGTWEAEAGSPSSDRAPR